MGNCPSSYFIPASSRKRTAKVIDAQGNLKKFKVPAKAAELMLEEPGHIIAPVEELKRTRRVVAMRADDELLAGRVYVLVPIARVHCKIMDVDLAIIEAASSGKKRARKSGAKVSPDVPEGLRKEEQSDFKVLGEKCTKGIHGYRLGNYRPWTPVLEPISEVN